MALLAVADVYAGEQCCRQGGNLVIETIMARRSVRMYKDMPVERCKLQKIVECGINAPSGMNKQPWQVRVVDSREGKSADGRRRIVQEYVPQRSGGDIHSLAG